MFEQSGTDLFAIGFLRVFVLICIRKCQEGRKYNMLGFPNSITRKNLHMNLPVFCRTQFGKCTALSRIIFRNRA